MNSLILLRCPEEWQQYCLQLCAAAGLDHAATRWGNGPAAYPCLVLSYVVPGTRPQKIVSCYVYPDDARRLLAADIQQQATGQHQVVSPGMIAISPAAVMGPVPAQAAALAAENAARIEHTNDTLRSLSAHVLALVSELVAVGVTNHERYEAAYAKYLALADQVVAEKADVGPVVKAVPRKDEG